MNLLRFTTAGSVDDGKSTLIGRLLFDSKSVFIDQMEAVEKTSQRKGLERIDFSLLTDGLKDEREQGITIDVAYRYFATPARKFIIADTPGHIQYTRNMVTGASTADAALILVDARHGVVEQTRRHSFLAGLLGIPHIMVCINKMDLVDFSEEAYQRIVDAYASVQAAAGLQHVAFIPISALLGDNVVDPSPHMPWYTGPTLLRHLETLEVARPETDRDFRFPVQTVIRPHSDDYHDFRGYAGRVASGQIRVGDLVTVQPSGLQSQVDQILLGDTALTEAKTGQSVAITLKDDVDISRGDTLVAGTAPRLESTPQATLCWLDNQAQRPGAKYIIRQGSADARAIISQVDGILDIQALEFQAPEGVLSTNSISQVQLKITKPLVMDSYRQNRITGSFILVDETSGATVAAGMLE
ncbi:MAG: sulfate adenylyltransferase [Flavobacteriia bacterium]|nr:sulfate adenylyltransferase [Flavobacteriia bacterium]